MSASTPYAQSATGASASSYGNSYPVGSSHRHGHGYDGSCYNPWSGGWGGGTGGPEFGGYGSYGNGGYGDVGYSSGYFGYGYGENLGYGFNGFDGLLFFTATWFIFVCVFGLFTMLRRARMEYATLCLFSTGTNALGTNSISSVCGLPHRHYRIWSCHGEHLCGRPVYADVGRLSVLCEMVCVLRCLN